MRHHLTLLILIAAAFALAGCGDDVDLKTARTNRMAIRAKKAEQKLAQPPATRTFNMPTGQLLVMEVPSLDDLGLLENQRCFVWRDAELRAASISCPHPPEADLSAGN